MNARLTAFLLLILTFLLAPAGRAPAAESPAAAGAPPRAEAPPDRSPEVNAQLAKALGALLERKWGEAETVLQQIIAASPDAPQWEFYQALGRAQLGLRKYEEAIRTYDRGIALARQHAGSDPDPGPAKAGVEQMLTVQGNAYLMLKQSDLAIARFTEAAAISTKPATALYNICATLYNTGDMGGAARAADRAIAADPTKADAWFIKGSALYGSGHLEGSRYVVPADTADALRKYLELAPEGGHAVDVRAMLDTLAQTPATPGSPAAK